MHICSERNNRISCKLRNLNFLFLIIMIESQYASIYCNDFFKDNRRCLLGSCRLIPFKLNGNQACTFYLNLYIWEQQSTVVLLSHEITDSRTSFRSLYCELFAAVVIWLVTRLVKTMPIQMQNSGSNFYNLFYITINKSFASCVKIKLKRWS